MSALGLADIPSRCFDGGIPLVLSTCSAEGTPNATWLSQVFRVDERHVALSCQFFRKTRKNLEAHPVAQLLVIDPVTVAQWELDLRFSRRDTAGATFDAMKLRIEAIAELTGMGNVFALQSADVFEVLAVTPVGLDLARPVEQSPPSADALAGLARLTDSIAGCTDLGALIESGMGVLTSNLGYEGVSLYVLEESEDVLYALASRGFTRSGVGARVARCGRGRLVRRAPGGHPRCGHDA